VIWLICFGDLPPLGFQEPQPYAKPGTPSLSAFYPVQRNPSSTLHDEEDCKDRENRENNTPRKKMRTRAGDFCFPFQVVLHVVWAIGGWGLIDAIWSKMYSPCENNLLPCV